MKKLVVFYLIIFLSGCTSISLKREKGDENILTISIFQSKEDSEKRNPGPYGVLSELFIYKDGKWEKIKATMVPAYSIFGIEEGKYLLKVEKFISKEGHIEDLKGKKQKVIKIKKGENVNVNVILKAPPPLGLIVVGILVGVAVIWALYEIIKDGNLDLPHPPDIEISPVLPDVFFHISLNYPFYYREGISYVDEQEPKLIANFPPHRDPKASKDTHIFLNFSEPIKKNWEKETLQVIGEKSGEVKGKIIFNSTQDLVEFMPEKEFLSGEKVYVTLNGDEVEDLWGNEMGDKLSFYFTIK